MTVPIKTLADTIEAFVIGTPDSDPHVTALATGGFMIEYTKVVSGSDTNLQIDRYSASGNIQGNAQFANPFADDSQGSSYSPANGNIILAWTDTPHATGDADIEARQYNLSS